MKKEFCIQSIQEFAIAEKHIVDRVELCSALSEGGLTSSIGLMERCKEIQKKVEIHSMIRPTFGHFNYTDDEFEIMKKEIQYAARIGVEGVVFGILDKENKIDIERNKVLIDFAKSKGLEVTFHRAFDMIKNNSSGALEELIKLDFNRVLTSGQKNKAIEGIDTLIEMHKNAKGRIEIMAGSGVSAQNARVFKDANLDAIHFTIAQTKINTDSMDYGMELEILEDKINGILKNCS